MLNTEFNVWDEVFILDDDCDYYIRKGRILFAAMDSEEDLPDKNHNCFFVATYSYEEDNKEELTRFKIDVGFISQSNLFKNQKDAVCEARRRMRSVKKLEEKE